MTTIERSKVAKVLGRLHGRIVLGVVATLVALPGAAESSLIARIDEAFRLKDWTEVERGSLRWAQEIDPEVPTVRAMAAAGLNDEAIAAARLARPWQRARLLVAAASGSDLNAARKLEVLETAVEAAQTDALPVVSKASNLANIALAYGRLGEEAKAHRTFDAAIANAEQHSTHGAYGVLTDELLLTTRVQDVPLWMLDGIARHKRLPTSENVRVHRSLAAGYFRLRQPAKAVAQLEIALSGALDLRELRNRNIAVQSLAKLALDNDAIDFARRHGELDELGVEMSAFHARMNEQGKALAAIARLGSGNLYVAPRAAAALRIINDVVDRHLIDEALHYCALLCKYIGRDEIRIRARIGGMQAQAGQKERAMANFLLAKELLRSGSDMASSDVLTTLELAFAAEASGMHAVAKDVVATAVRQAAYVSLSRRKAERPLSEARTAQALAKLGDVRTATEMLARAWSNTSQLPDDHLGGKRQKAEALLAIAEAARTLKPAARPPN
ncbi:MAG: hypothetical protein EOO80_08085 [Oxalobacteraceae bacterium]|nr:MAG: hypothetical protein EOO80_08085 [Oxalobacteraceae bacterium]